MKTLIKQILEKYAPRLRYAVKSYNDKRFWAKRYGKFQKQMRKKIFSGGDPAVLSGPFASMRYIDEIVWGTITPKWLGTYECELHPVIKKIISEAKLETIIDVGAAEGYYAVGLAKHLPCSTVFSFDYDFRGRRQQRHLAKLNYCNNLVVGFRCDSGKLQKLIKANSTLIICDIEGFEVQLLDPSKVPALKDADILVEIHPAQGRSPSEVRDLLKARFIDSHQVETIDSRARDAASFRHLLPPGITDEEFSIALDEGRNGQQYWLWMERK